MHHRDSLSFRTNVKESFIFELFIVPQISDPTRPEGLLACVSRLCAVCCNVHDSVDCCPQHNPVELF